MIRHPIYCGTIVSVVATAAIFGIPSSLLGAALIAISMMIKARREEEFLCDETGGAYDDYIDRVPMLVPFLRF